MISRRSGGLSIGINLNPDGACNFDCVYCQVDRSGEPKIRKVNIDRLREELARMLTDVEDGALWRDAAFSDVPTDQRCVRDIAFSGDGEPTTSKHFRASVELVAELKREADLPDAKIVLITDACYLTKPDVAAALAIMDDHNGEIWAKLDAGTEEYYRKVNRPNLPLRHVVDNITAAARVRPVVLQSLFMRINGEPPADGELAAYLDRLREISAAGGQIKLVQVYTVARRPAEDWVTSLTDDQVDRITGLIRQAGFPAEPFYGIGG